MDIITVPASEKKIVSYTTTDGETFNDKWKAERHQRLIDALKVRDTLDEYDGWFRVCSQAELESLWLCKSDGRWWDSGKKHYISFPAWVQVSVYQDRDRYWHTEIISLEDCDLRRMASSLTNALCVIVKTPHIRGYLGKNDPKALEQCLDALDEY